MSALDQRKSLARWVASHVMPHEPKVRAWLRRYRVSAEDADELVQEAYCRLATLDRIDHIQRPDAYFFSVVRNLLLRRLKRKQVVEIEVVAEIDSYRDDLRPSPEQQAVDHMDYEKIVRVIATLPHRCQLAVRLRKIEGWSQREIADHMGTTEKAVEKQIWLGVRAIRAALTGADERSAKPVARARKGLRP